MLAFLFFILCTVVGTMGLSCTQTNLTNPAMSAMMMCPANDVFTSTAVISCLVIPAYSTCPVLQSIASLPYSIFNISLTLSTCISFEGCGAFYGNFSVPAWAPCYPIFQSCATAFEAALAAMNAPSVAVGMPSVPSGGSMAGTPSAGGSMKAPSVAGVVSPSAPGTAGSPSKAAGAPANPSAASPSMGSTPTIITTTAPKGEASGLQIAFGLLFSATLSVVYFSI
jgi:hypothetical protein